MKRGVVVLAGLLLLLAVAATAQTFQECADVSQDGTLNVMDVITMIDEHRGGPAIPAGTGDIDLRQGYNSGDLRYLLGYIFAGWPEGGCPPFDPYSLLTGSDTLYLPSVDVAPGSGEFSMPIVLVNHNPVADLVLPLTVTGLDASISFDSLTVNPGLLNAVPFDGVTGTEGVVGFDYLGLYILEPGLNVIASAYFSYSSFAGGTIAMDTITLREHTFPNYVYCETADPRDYDDYVIGIPTVTSLPSGSFPTMSIDVDTLYFETLVGYPDPDPQYLTVVSDGDPISWFSSSPGWIELNPAVGISGTPVEVTAHIDGLPTGVHYENILISSTEAIGSPQTVVAKVTLKAQFPSFDANCDGVFNISDVMVQINYIFGGGAPPCDPCTGEPWGK